MHYGLFQLVVTLSFSGAIIEHKVADKGL